MSREKPVIEKSTGCKDDSFVGIKIINNRIVFKYPESYDFSYSDEKDEYTQILKIMRTFTLTKMSSASDVANSKFEHEYDTPLLSFLWILNDYLMYHQYANREKLMTRDLKGKISWKRTIKQIPYVQDMQAIYPSVYSEKYMQHDDIIVDIYKYCVEDAINKIGWLYNLNKDDYLRTKKHPYNKKIFISILNDEINKTFDDVKKNRLKHMINIITGLDSSSIETNKYTFGVDSYENIYESMLRHMFSNIKNIQEFYPSADWYLITDNQTKKSSNLRPDIIMVNDVEHKIYVLDAKYYRFGTTGLRGDLPDSTSTQKQITYGEYIKNLKLKNYEVFSCFIMPYNKNNNIFGLKKDIEYVGMAIAPWAGSSNVNNKVVAILLDTKYLIDHWFLYNKNASEELCNLIEQKTKSFKHNS